MFYNDDTVKIIRSLKIKPSHSIWLEYNDDTDVVTKILLLTEKQLKKEIVSFLSKDPGDNHSLIIDTKTLELGLVPTFRQFGAMCFVII